MSSLDLKLPSRIVCLTEETTEWLYMLGQQDRIVGISGYTVRPPAARKEKPRISAFLSAKINEILALKPDHVFGFSELQADIASTLIRNGVPVTIFNQRSVEEIFSMLYQVGSIVGQSDEAIHQITLMKAHLKHIKVKSETFKVRQKYILKNGIVHVFQGFNGFQNSLRLQVVKTAFQNWQFSL